MLAGTIRGENADIIVAGQPVEVAVWSVSPDLPVASLRTMQEIYDRSLCRTSFTLLMLIAAAASALVLGAGGAAGLAGADPDVAVPRRDVQPVRASGARPALHGDLRSLAHGFQQHVDQVALRDEILADNLTVRQAELKAREMVEAGAARRGKAKPTTAHTASRPAALRIYRRRSGRGRGSGRSGDQGPDAASARRR